MATIRLPNDFKEFLQLLNSHAVEYLLIGGYAVGYYGYPRATGDMDIWIAVHLRNAEKIVRVLQEFGFPPSSLSTEMFLQQNRVFRMGMPPLRIELLTTISGVAFDECYSERTIDTVDGVEVALISLDRLLENKRASGRYKDLNDMENLTET